MENQVVGVYIATLGTLEPCTSEVESHRFEVPAPRRPLRRLNLTRCLDYLEQMVSGVWRTAY